MGGGWAWLLSIVILLMFNMKLIRIPSAGVRRLYVGIFSSLQGWLCVGVLCALQCAKNSVGSCRQSHGCLNVCRISFRVTYNGLQLQEVGDFEAQNCLPPQNLIRSTKIHLTTEPPIFCRCCYAQVFS